MIEAIDNIGLELFFGSSNAFADQMALLLTNAYTWIPMFIALLFLIIKNNDNMQQILFTLLAIGLCLLIASGTANFIAKPLTERLRPCNDPMFKYMAQIAGDIHERDFSFFSSHAANTMAIATFFTLLVRSYLLSIVLYLWSLINIWTRLYLGQHFLTDILVGLLWGILSGVIAYFIYKHVTQSRQAGKRFISTQYTATGFSHLDVDVVSSVFFLILCFATMIYPTLTCI